MAQPAQPAPQGAFAGQVPVRVAILQHAGEEAGAPVGVLAFEGQGGVEGDLVGGTLAWPGVIGRGWHLAVLVAC